MVVIRDYDQWDCRAPHGLIEVFCIHIGANIIVYSCQSLSNYPFVFLTQMSQLGAREMMAHLFRLKGETFTESG